jgi:hypothetical protein
LWRAKATSQNGLMDENQPPHRSRLRFGIRDLLWAMAFCGALLGWWLEYRHDRVRQVLIEEAEMVIDMQAEGVSTYSKAPDRGYWRNVPVHGKISYPDGTTTEWTYEAPEAEK